MLSMLDIKKELGKNIYIYPIHHESIKANSIDLHASKFGWSRKTKKPLQEETGYLILPANDTSLIYTEEAIYVSNKIGGSYHSKVMYVSAGLGHIGTTLDAKYIGLSLIAIHNHNNEDFKLEIGHELVTLQFYYLHTEGYKDGQLNDNFAGHPRVLNGYDTTNYIVWTDRNTWCTNSRLLYTKMVDSPEYKQLKKDFDTEKRKFSRYKVWHGIKHIAIWIGILLSLSLIFFIPAYIVDSESINTLFSKICETFLFPIWVAVLASVITYEISKYRND